jgi:putative lipoic acid-binding regulatory protein
MHDHASCFTFPCSYPLKVMGQKSDAFEKAVREIIMKHLQGAPVVYDSRPSGTGKYLAITATFTAVSKAQLDAIYQELNDHELVVMTL